VGPAGRRRHSTTRPGGPSSAIVQGGVYPDLRARSAEALKALGFDGYAVGGLAVARARRACSTCLTNRAAFAGRHPRYLMGVGKPDDLIGAVMRGVDMFDCVLPTPLGPQRSSLHPPRAGKSAQRAPREDSRPLDETCRCPMLQELRACLSASPRESGRDFGLDAADLAQP